MKRITRALVILISLAALCVSCGSRDNGGNIFRTGFYFDTAVKITLYEQSKESVLDGCFSLCERYEDIFSPTKEDSELYRLNTANGLGQCPQTGRTCEISKELYECIDLASEYAALTDYRYNIALRPVSELWNFRDNPDSTLPDEALIEARLQLVGKYGTDYELSCSSDKYYLITHRPGVEFDLGSVVKGYAADSIARYLKDNGVGSALIDLGGNIMCVGSKPSESGQDDFKVGISNPFTDRQIELPVLSCSDMTVVTSGIYQRFFVKEDRIYHHILDAHTGYPFETDIVSVSVAGPSSVDADILSTVCFILGEDRCKDVLSQKNAGAIFIYSDGSVSIIGNVPVIR